MSLLSTYSQHIRYWKIQGITVCAREKFRIDLVTFMKYCRAKGGIIILILNENEIIQTGKLARESKIGTIHV